MLARTALLLAGSLLATPLLAAERTSDRFFQATEGFVKAEDLPEDFRAQVRSIQLAIKDAFEGATVHSEAEQWLFDVGNKLHIDSRPGTIRRRLLFREGDSVTKDFLLEAQKALRGEEFLADAIIEVKKREDGTAHVIVTTYDQWTTVPGVSLQYKDEWVYWIGPVESNLLGTGQRVGFFAGHDQLRDTYWIDYNNNALFPQRLRLSAHLAWMTDGHNVAAALSRPLESRTTRYAFNISVSSTEYSDLVFFDGNLLEKLPDSLARARAGRYNVIQRFDRAATHDFNVSFTRAFGHQTRLAVSPIYDRKDQYHGGNVLRYDAQVRQALGIPLGQVLPYDTRTDNLLGITLSVYQYAYKTVHNFRNLKWSETIATGWRLSTKAAANQEWMGARNSNFYLSHGAVFNNAWWNRVFLGFSGSLAYYVSPEGDLEDGDASAWSEIQWKPHRLTSTYLSTSWAHLFATEDSRQFLLGVDHGLNGYPSFYYAGKARFLVEAEQRFFPPFEAGTIVPALALFANVGNTYPAYDKFDWDDLHYALGFGLRLGASKSVQKVVNHINLAWPIGDKYLKGPSFSLIAKKSL